MTTALLDLAGTALAESFDLTFSLGGPDEVVYLAPDPDLLTASTVGNPAGFHGLPADPTTGLIYARHRWYDPELARFTTTDPMGFADSPNPYQYALNNPLAFSDPLGLCVDGRDEDGRICGPTGEEMLEFGVGIVVGLFSHVYDLVADTADAIGHPGETAHGLFGIILDPSRLNDPIDATLRSSAKGLASPDPGTVGETASGPLFEGFMAVGTGGAGTAARTASRLARAGRMADRAADASRWSRRADQGARAARSGRLASAVDDLGALRRVSTGKRRNELPLTAAQQAEARAYARELGVPDHAIRFTENMNTSYGSMFGREVLNIGTDVLPGVGRGRTANSRISMRGALAHEIVGHRAAAIAGRAQAVAVLEEAQASIRAARFAPNLTPVERFTLLRDAVTRLRDRQIRVRTVRDMLWIDHP